MQLRADRQLIDATRPFAHENRAKSWWHVGSGFALLATTTTLSGWLDALPLRLMASVLAALVILRVFILYHDFMHRSILRGSTIARLLMHCFGMLVLAPPKVWRRTHDYHHANTAKIAGSHVGAFPTLSSAMYAALSPRRRLAYRVARHPATMLFGYLTVFIWGMGLGPLIKNPRRSWDSGLALVLYGALCAGAGIGFGLDVLLFAVVLPHALACALGSYLFYAQHNYPGMKLRPRTAWTYTGAALEACSYMKLGPVMRWFSGDIGYHHVHHLNPSIPFYRLAEAMAAIPALQRPGDTTLRRSDILACLRLRLWDADQGKMVGHSMASHRTVLRSTASHGKVLRSTTPRNEP